MTPLRRSDYAGWSCSDVGTAQCGIMRGMTETREVRLTAWVHGRVHGVGFRWWTRAKALELGLVGSATNLPAGRVEVVAEGSRSECERLLTALRSGDTPGVVEYVAEQWSEPKGGLSGFVER